MEVEVAVSTTMFAFFSAAWTVLAGAIRTYLLPSDTTTVAVLLAVGTIRAPGK